MSRRAVKAADAATAAVAYNDEGRFLEGRGVDHRTGRVELLLRIADATMHAGDVARGQGALGLKAHELAQRSDRQPASRMAAALAYGEAASPRRQGRDDGSPAAAGRAPVGPTTRRPACGCRHRVDPRPRPRRWRATRPACSARAQRWHRPGEPSTTRMPVGWRSRRCGVVPWTPQTLDARLATVKRGGQLWAHALLIFGEGTKLLSRPCMARSSPATWTPLRRGRPGDGTTTRRAPASRCSRRSTARRTSCSRSARALRRGRSPRRDG